MPLTPWYKVVAPREDLREGRAFTEADFAVHLDQVRDKRAPEDYRNPELFFARTFLTQTLLTLSSQVARRLSGNMEETSAVFNLATQFGGGKTHALTLLYHLARNGSAAERWPGVEQIMRKAGIRTLPKAETAVFVGTEFDSLKGRGGDDGTPLRKTPWGEIAYQLGGEEALKVLAQHEAEFVEPKGDVIRAFLPKDRPCLILMDEIINYVSTYRSRGYHNRLYNFIQSLSETARGLPNVVLVVSIPKSEIEVTAEDVDDEQRFKKMLDRIGKPIMMSAETETSEIIRRRLFEWDLRAVGQNGRVQLPKDAIETAKAYADWVSENREWLPQNVSQDSAREMFELSYPFHPMVLSVFERKWQSLPRFQQTRGVLRMLAHWVSRAYRDGYNNVYRDPLIDLGTAPLDEANFRAAVFEQLGENKLEAPVITDICGQRESHATRLDAEATNDIRKARLHRKIATSIFFESNGGQAQNYATLPEIRMAVASPNLEVANVETVLDALVPPNGACYYLDTNKNRYSFSIKPNLTKLLADRKAGVQPAKIDELVRAEIEKVFGPLQGVERIFFPASSAQIPNQPVLTLVVMHPDQSPHDHATLDRIETFTREWGTSSRTFKSALIWVMAEGPARMREDARKLLAWETINNEKDELPLEDSQRRQIESNLKSARSDLRESVWRAYNHIALLDKNNTLQVHNHGLINSSQAPSLVQLIITRLQTSGDIESGIGPSFLERNWPALKEWSTKGVRDAFFASPKFPRLLNGNVVKETIAKGVTNGFFGYVGKGTNGKYHPFVYGTGLQASEVEISDDMYIITKDTAEAYQKRILEETEPYKPEVNGEPVLTSLLVSPEHASIKPRTQQQFAVRGLDQYGNVMPLDYTIWSATGGEINPSGLLIADHQPGNYEVTALVGEITGTAAFIITDGRGPGPLPPPPQLRKAIWQGEIPSQKWMNYYTRILARFATSKGLKISLHVEVAPEAGLTQQQIEEMKTSLRELGLNDDVRTE